MKYEYKVESVLYHNGQMPKHLEWAQTTEDNLNELASEGWEYIDHINAEVTNFGAFVRLIFRRSKN